MYSSPPPDLKGNSGVNIDKKHLWNKQNHGILTDGSLGDVNTKTVGTYGRIAKISLSLVEGFIEL